MASQLKSSSNRSRLALCLTAMMIPDLALAATYSDLVAKGYKTSSMTESRGGAPGWILSGGGKTYFCRLGVSVVLSGKNGMVSISSSGRQSPLDKQAYVKSRGASVASFPRLEDLKAGRLKPEYVRECTIY